MPELACVNGEFCPISQARVSIEDRGFQFADGIYEVVLFYGFRPFMLDEHLERLENSAREIDLDLGRLDVDLRNLMAEGVRRAGLDQTMVYLQITRGAAPRQHLAPTDCTPTVVMTFKPKPTIDEQVRRRGYRVRTVEDFRWTLCHTKSLVLLPSVIAKGRAVRDGYDDILWVGPEDRVREAAAANVFVITNGTLITPPRDNAILHGVTRKWVLGCAEEIDLPIREDHLTLQQLLAADEIFLSSTTIDVMPVTGVDDHVIGDGKPGRWSRAVYDRMQGHIEGLLRAEAV